VLARDGRHGPVIHDCNAAAAALGLRRGARVTDMRALVPELRVETADEAADEADLERLAGWCRRWCPWTRADGMDGLLLDTTGSDHLWGGEAAMLEDMSRALTRLDLSARIAVAPTIGSAWALARYGDGKGSICRPEDLPAHLAPLPVEALRLDDETVLLLRRLGLKTIGTLIGLPRLALARRFRREKALTANPLLRLDQALGRTTEPLMPVQPETPLRTLRRLLEPIGDVDSVARVLGDLLDELGGAMGAADFGARRLRLTGYRVDGGASAVEAATSRGSRDPAHLARLFSDRLESLDPGFGFEVMTLDVLVHEPLEAVQKDLAGRGGEDVELSCLIDRLSARLGSGAVLRPMARGSHLPERAEVMAVAGAKAPLEPEAVVPGPQRPLRLLARPEEVRVLYSVPDGPPAQFQWRRQTLKVVRAQGPERIAPEWWREKSTARLRDYYRVEDAEGRRYWIFREGLPGDGRGGPPRWFVHGLDA